MTHIINCKDCGREIAHVELMKDIVIMSCCKKAPKPKSKYRPRAIYNAEEKMEFVLSHIKPYRDYMVASLYDKVKDKIGCYRTFDRQLRILAENNKIRRFRFMKQVIIRRVGGFEQ